MAIKYAHFYREFGCIRNWPEDIAVGLAVGSGCVGPVAFVVSTKVSHTSRHGLELNALPLSESTLRQVIDVDPGDRSRVNESPHPARLGRAFHHETYQVHGGADHPQAGNC